MVVIDDDDDIICCIYSRYEPMKVSLSLRLRGPLCSGEHDVPDGVNGGSGLSSQRVDSLSSEGQQLPRLQHNLR